MISIKIDTTELDRLAKRIQAVAEVAERPHTFMQQLAQGVIDQTVARIEYEKESPDGQKWKPWSANYAATREPGDSLLIDSRDLIDSFQKRVSGRSFAIWTDVEYAGVHNWGGGNNIPQREFLGFSAENISNIEDWLQSILLGAIKGVPVKKLKRKGRRK